MWRDLPIDLISRSPIARWAPIPLRLIVGYGFMEHGFAKLAKGPDAFAHILQAISVPVPLLETPAPLPPAMSAARTDSTRE